MRPRRRARDGLNGLAPRQCDPPASGSTSAERNEQRPRHLWKGQQRRVPATVLAAMLQRENPGCAEDMPKAHALRLRQWVDVEVDQHVVEEFDMHLGAVLPLGADHEWKRPQPTAAAIGPGGCVVIEEGACAMCSRGVIRSVPPSPPTNRRPRRHPRQPALMFRWLRSVSERTHDPRGEHVSVDTGPGRGFGAQKARLSANRNVGLCHFAGAPGIDVENTVQARLQLRDGLDERTPARLGLKAVHDAVGTEPFGGGDELRGGGESCNSADIRGGHLHCDHFGGVPMHERRATRAPWARLARTWGTRIRYMHPVC